jgi:hypothetical protein
MAKRINYFLLGGVFFFLGFHIACWSITPGEVFEDGRRAFILGNWLEAREQFQRFNDTWPHHHLAPLSLYFRTLSEVRIDKGYDPEQTREKIASLSWTIKALSDQLPSADLNQLKTEIDFLKSRIGQDTASVTLTLGVSPEHLRHALDRGWMPFSESQPLKAIDWIRQWLKINAHHAPLELQGRLELLKAKALWQFRLSPLPTQALMSTLESWGEWPVQEAVDRSLKQAFKKGNTQTKRETALLGVSSDYVKSGKRSNFLQSHWMRYLQEKGINFTEAWCPR